MSIVFVGAGGSGLSALVHIMNSLQVHDMICIDSSETKTMQDFRSAGITTYIGHDIYEVTPEDIVIYSAATPNSREVQTAFSHARTHRKSCVPMLYFEFLGETSKYMYTIAISGTHGKSTTTGMTALACIENIPVTSLAILGAGVTQREGKNARYNDHYKNELHAIILRIISRKTPQLTIPYKKLLFVVEADEFNHHFLFLEPDISIITCVDHDHTDIYPTRENYVLAFNQFCSNTKEIIFAPQGVAQEFPDQKNKIQVPKNQIFTFEHLIGGHNHTNASLALAAATYYQEKNDLTSSTSLKKSLEHFRGLERRMELLGKNTHGISIFSDYGHHPDEIKSTIHSFQETYPDVSITCIFEAHQARRLLSFRDDFIAAFSGVACYMVPIYTARETIEELPKYTITLPTSLANKSITSFEQIAHMFCKQIKGTYVANRNLLPETVNSITTGVVLCFSAGVLDSKLRDSLP